MTILDCSVKGCLHNKDNCCCKNEIMVDGSSAMRSCDTNCESFDKRSDSSYRNAVREEPKKPTEVNCKATNCTYNSGGLCSADHIGISGHTAMTSAQTECASFQAR